MVALAAAQSTAAVHSVTAAARRQWQHQWRWRQHDSASSAEAWRRRGGSGSVSSSGSSAKRGGGAQGDGGSAVAAARRLLRIHRHRPQMCRRTCLRTPPTRDVRIFVISRGWRDNSTEGIVLVGSNGGARGDVHRGRQCAAAANDDTTDDDTAKADGDGDSNDIVC